MSLFSLAVLALDCFVCFRIVVCKVILNRVTICFTTFSPSCPFACPFLSRSFTVVLASPLEPSLTLAVQGSWVLILGDKKLLLSVLICEVCFL